VPSPSMSPAVTNPPNVKLASPNGSLGGTSTDPSLPLTTAITVFGPRPGHQHRVLDPVGVEVTRRHADVPAEARERAAHRRPPRPERPDPVGVNSSALPSARPETTSGPAGPAGAAAVGA